jgi:dTDP-4-amino-4,6-dideoxygalactose transaminase
MSVFKVPRSRAHLTHLKMRDELFRALEPVLFEPYTLDNLVLRPLEAYVASLLEQSYAYAVSSATSGLFLALRACGIGPGDEVITVGNSDLSTSAAISHCGATPVFCDVREDDHTIDASLVEPLIGARTRALLPVDLYGHPADVRALREIATRHGLKIVEDGALALGARDYGRPVGAFADITVISFNAGKPLGSVGNGGIVVTNDARLAEQVRLLRGYGRSLANAGTGGGTMEHVVEGYNLPLDPLASAVVLQKLPLLESWTERRRALAAIYTEGLRDLDVRLPRFREESEPNFHSYVVGVRNRDQIHEGLRARGIESVLHYTPPVYRQPVYRDRGFETGHLKVTDRLSEELICLPVAPELEDHEVEYVIETLEQLLRGAAAEGRDTG